MNIAWISERCWIEYPKLYNFVYSHNLLSRALPNTLMASTRTRVVAYVLAISSLATTSILGRWLPLSFGLDWKIWTLTKCNLTQQRYISYTSSYIEHERFDSIGICLGDDVIDLTASDFFFLFFFFFVGFLISHNDLRSQQN